MQQSIKVYANALRNKGKIHFAKIIGLTPQQLKEIDAKAFLQLFIPMVGFKPFIDILIFRFLLLILLALFAALYSHNEESNYFMKVLLENVSPFTYIFMTRLSLGTGLSIIILSDIKIPYKPWFIALILKIQQYVKITLSSTYQLGFTCLGIILGNCIALTIQHPNYLNFLSLAYAILVSGQLTLINFGFWWLNVTMQKNNPTPIITKFYNRPVSFKIFIYAIVVLSFSLNFIIMKQFNQ